MRKLAKSRRWQGLLLLCISWSAHHFFLTPDHGDVFAFPGPTIECANYSMRLYFGRHGYTFSEHKGRHILYTNMHIAFKSQASKMFSMSHGIRVMLNSPWILRIEAANQVISVKFRMLQSDDRFVDAACRPRSWDAGVCATRVAFELRSSGRAHDAQVAIFDSLSGSSSSSSSQECETC